MEEPRFDTKICDDPQPFKEKGSKKGLRTFNLKSHRGYLANKFWDNNDKK